MSRRVGVTRWFLALPIHVVLALEAASAGKSPVLCEDTLSVDAAFPWMLENLTTVDSGAAIYCPGIVCIHPSRCNWASWCS